MLRQVGHGGSRGHKAACNWVGATRERKGRLIESGDGGNEGTTTELSAQREQKKGGS